MLEASASGADGLCLRALYTRAGVKPFTNTACFRPPDPNAFKRPSSANFLRGFLCKVVLSISPTRQNESFRIFDFLQIAILRFDRNSSYDFHPVAVIHDPLYE